MAEAKVEAVLNPKGRFLRSVNLERDFSDSTALDGYVVTPQVSLCAQRLASGLRPNSGQRAWRVTGDYGSGKSSFALFLAHLFSESRSVLPVSQRRAVDFSSLGIARPQLFPILISGSREPLGSTLLRSLLLSTAHAYVHKKTQLEIVRASRRLISAIEKGKTVDHEIVKLLEHFAELMVSSKRASGILLLIDELGKFLEFGAAHPERQDVHLLQLVAEAASRSGSKQLFVVGLLHQGFSSYADNLSPLAQREWEKVAGRFEEMIFSHPLEEIASLVADALNVREQRVPTEVVKAARKGMRSTLKLGWYGASASRSTLEALASKMYPIHPSVLPVLTRLFSRFGQNERTLFGFLLSDELFALKEFAGSHRLGLGSFFQLHHLYDYARSSFGSRLSAQSFRSHWNHIESLIESFHTNSEMELNLLKTVGLLNVLDATNLIATEEALMVALGFASGHDSIELKSALRRLRSKHVLYDRGVAGGLCLWPHTSVNLEVAYEDSCKTVSAARENVMQAVMDHLETRPVVARRHYIETGTLRHFAVRYASPDSIEKAAEAETLEEDGRIVVALCATEEERRRALRTVQTGQIKKSDLAVVAVSRPLQMLSGLVQEVRRWEWILQSTPELANDKFALEEVSRQLATARQSFGKRLRATVGLQSGDESGLEWYYKGRKLNVQSGKSLTSELSRICAQVYISSPRVHNELVNRRSLSSAASAARMRLMEAIFRSPDRSYLGMDSSRKPPEMSIYLSLLRDSGVHRSVGKRWVLDIPEDEVDVCRLRPALEHIHRILGSARMARVPVRAIFEELRKAPFGIRDGLLPVLLAIFAVANEQHVAFYDTGIFMPKMEGLDVMRLAKVPEAFDIQYCDIGGVRAALFTELLKLFKTGKKVQSRPDLLDIVRPMCVFAAGLPLFAQTTTRLQRTALEVRRVLLESRDPAALVFRDLPKACGFQAFDGNDRLPAAQIHEFVSALRSAITELRMAYPRLLDEMKIRVTDGFASDVVLSKARRVLAERSQRVVIAVSEPRLRAFCNRLIDESLPETEWIESLGSLMCGVPPSKWTDHDFDRFGQELQVFASRFGRVEAITFSGRLSTESVPVRVCLTSGDGSEVQKVLFIESTNQQLADDFERTLQQMISQHRVAAQSAMTKTLWNSLASEDA